jgi:SAM-dependent methyltransferase
VRAAFITVIYFLSKGNNNMTDKEDIFEWLKTNFKPKSCSSVELLYEHMASQSLEYLPIIYKPFDPHSRNGWNCRGVILDFLLSVDGEAKTLLDFGPGDGWPSLLVAPFAHKVIGVDGSMRRVEVCRENAKRLSINNAQFVHYTPGSPLPFDDGTFDGIMAASSIEQSPEPQKIISEFYRLLKPGGKVRITCESLQQYRNGLARDIFIFEQDSKSIRIILFDRDIDAEKAYHIGFTVAMPKKEFVKIAVGEDKHFTFDILSINILKKVESSILDVRECSLYHPSGITLSKWLETAGFENIMPLHCGGRFAAKLFDNLPANERPDNLADIDRFLKPIIKALVDTKAPFDETSGSDINIRAGKR